MRLPVELPNPIVITVVLFVTVGGLCVVKISKDVQRDPQDLNLLVRIRELSKGKKRT